MAVVDTFSSSRRLSTRVRRAVSIIGLLSAAVLMITGLLLDRIAGSATHATSADTVVESPTAPLLSIPSDHSPVLDFSGPGTEARTPVRPRRTLALTFEDGPDQSWTPKLLDVLARHEAKATFFVVGAKVIQHPDVVEATIAAGHEVGNHSYSHQSLGSATGLRQRFELSATNVALANAGVTTRIMRPPNSSVATNLSAGELAAARQSGYLVVLTDNVASDASGTSADDIVTAVVPNGDEGAIVTFHDGGTDPARTIEAVDKLLTELSVRRYKFVTVSEFSGLALHAGIGKPSAIQRLAAFGVVSVMALSRWVGTFALIAALALLALMLLRAVVMIVFARKNLWFLQQRRVVAATTDLPSITAIVLANHNAEATHEVVRRVELSNYPTFDIVTVHSPSPEALRSALAQATGNVIVVINGDAHVEPRTLRELGTQFVNQKVGAVGGMVRLIKPAGLLGRMQHMTAVVGDCERLMFDELGHVMRMPHALVAYRREVLNAVGGLPADGIAQQTEVAMAVQRAGWKVAFAPNAGAWITPHATYASLLDTQRRSTFGSLQALAKHRSSSGPKPGGRLGRLAIPFAASSLLVAALGPFVDVFALVAVVKGRAWFGIGTWLAVNAVALAVSGFACFVDGERFRSLLALPAQQFVQRQMLGVATFAALRRVVRSRLRRVRFRRRNHPLPQPSQLVFERPLERSAHVERQPVGSR
jgi:peptidoglycan/xylan/chitin deacetylase (PgdA/CDA1 family)